MRIQVYGLPVAGADVKIVAGDPAEGRFAAAYEADGRLVAGLAWKMPREGLKLRKKVAASATASAR